MDPLIKSSNQSEPLENNIVNTDYFSYKLRFTGNGSEYFGILIVNWFLTIITFGIYYPWARAKSLRYIYGSTTLNNERFHFSGTGLEMFNQNPLIGWK